MVQKAKNVTQKNSDGINIWKIVMVSTLLVVMLYCSNQWQQLFPRESRGSFSFPVIHPSNHSFCQLHVVIVVVYTSSLLVLPAVWKYFSDCCEQCCQLCQLCKVLILFKSCLALWSKKKSYKKWSKFKIGVCTYGALGCAKMEPGCHARKTEFRFHYTGNIIL